MRVNAGANFCRLQQAFCGTKVGRHGSESRAHARLPNCLEAILSVRS